MPNWYAPYFGQAALQYQAPPTTELRTPEGELIYLGPFTKEQAPYIECSNCGQPITVGQELLPDMSTRLLGITQSGRLVYVTTPSQEGVAPVHADCTAEFAHDHITKEPCGRDEGDGECRFCGIPINDNYGACSSCSEKFGLPE